MKKFFSYLIAGLLLASCSSEDLAGPETGTTQEVKLSIQLPKSISSRASGANSALGGASNCSGEITFTIVVNYKGREVWRENKTAAIPNADAAVTFTPLLTYGEEYEIMAYAQMDGVVDDFTAHVEANAINDETVDAYYATTTIKAVDAMSLTLKRATGKLRIIAEDFAATEAQLGKKISSVKIKYRQPQPTIFNSQNGTWASEATETEFSKEIVTYTNETSAKTLLVDYIPATDGGEIINIESVIVTFSDGNTFEKNLSTLDIPIKRNYLTTLRGNFFMQEMDLRLEIESAFDGEDEIILTNHRVHTADEFVKAIAAGGNIEVVESFTIGAGQKALNTKQTIVKVNPGVTITVADNVTGGIWNQGKLTINNEGTIKGTETAEGRRCINNEQGATLILNGGDYRTNHEQNGSAISNIGGIVEANNISVSSTNYCVWNEGETASFVINGGTYRGTDDFSYAITNKLGAKMEINYASVFGKHGAIAVTQGAELIYNGSYGELASARVEAETAYAIYADATDGGAYPDATDVKVTINGGVFSSRNFSGPTSEYVIYAPENCDLLCTGGKIKINSAKQLANSVNLGVSIIRMDQGVSIVVEEKIEFNKPITLDMEYYADIILDKNGELINNTDLEIIGELNVGPDDKGMSNFIECLETNVKHRCITNGKNGKLTMRSIDLYSPYNQSGTAIYNYGEFVPSYCCIYNGFYGIYNDGGKVTPSRQLYIKSSSSAKNGQCAYAIRNTNGGIIYPLEFSSWPMGLGWGWIEIDAIHGGIVNEDGSTITLKGGNKITLQDSETGAGDSYYAVYCTGTGSVVNVESGTYTTVRDAFYSEDGGVINVSPGVVVNGVTK